MVAVGRPLGEIVERIGGDPVGYITRGERIWSCDLNTYRLLELARRGHSERWLRDQLAQKGMSRDDFEYAKGFALQADLLREYRAVDATLDGKRAFINLVIKRRMVPRHAEDDGQARWRVRLPEGEISVYLRIAEILTIWDGHPVADISCRLINSNFELNQSIAEPFWWMVRWLELGMAWLDVPEATGNGVKDGSGHFLKPASLWVEDDNWGAKPGSYDALMGGPITDDVKLLSLATLLGNVHGDSGWMVCTPRGEEIEVTRDEYALLADANMTSLSKIVPRVQEVALSMFAAGRIRKAANALVAKECLVFQDNVDLAPTDTAEVAS